MHTRNVNVKTATEKSSRKMGENQTPNDYLFWVGDWDKKTKEPGELEEFLSLKDLKAHMRKHPEKMSRAYYYQLTNGFDFYRIRHIPVLGASHLKQFIRALKKAGLDV